MKLPEQYIIQKFFEFNYSPKYNRYNNTYQAGCGICREGKSLGKLQRFYYLPDKDIMFCHNCGWSSKPFKWNKRVSGKASLEILQEVKSFKVEDDYDNDAPEKVPNVVKSSSLPDNCINLFDNMQLSYWEDNDIVCKCLDVINDRRLLTAINKPSALYVSLDPGPHQNRLLIPFQDKSNDIVFYQSRSITEYDLKNRPKYTSKINSSRSLFNLNNVDTSGDNVFIFEGPIDAFFVKNSVAVAGITEGSGRIFTDLQQSQWDRELRFLTRIWCLDSQWLDDASLSKSRYLLEAGEKVFIWPEDIGSKFKDLNDIAIRARRDSISQEYIQKNTFEGLKGIIKLMEIEKSRIC